jgi:hypothetical protein
MIAERPLLPQLAIERALLAGPTFAPDLLDMFKSSGFLTDGLPVETSFGLVRLYCVLNRDAVRHVRHGDLEGARALVARAREIEKSKEARWLAYDLAGEAFGSRSFSSQSALPGTPWFPVVFHELHVYRDSSRVTPVRAPRHLLSLPARDRPANASHGLKVISDAVVAARAAIPRVAGVELWTKLGRVSEVRKHTVCLTDLLGDVLEVPRGPIDRLALAQPGSALCVYCDALTQNDAVWSFEPALDFQGGGSDNPGEFDRFDQPDRVFLTADVGRWLRDELVHAAEPVLVAPLHVQRDDRK